MNYIFFLDNFPWSRAFFLDPYHFFLLAFLVEIRWEFIKENKNVRKHAFVQESDQEKQKDQESDIEKRKKITVKKKGRKHALNHESEQENKKKLSFFLDYFLGRERVFFRFSYILPHI